MLPVCLTDRETFFSILILSLPLSEDMTADWSVITEQRNLSPSLSWFTRSLSVLCLCNFFPLIFFLFNTHPYPLSTLRGIYKIPELPGLACCVVSDSDCRGPEPKKKFEPLRPPTPLSPFTESTVNVIIIIGGRKWRMSDFLQKIWCSLQAVFRILCGNDFSKLTLLDFRRDSPTRGHSVQCMYIVGMYVAL